MSSRHDIVDCLLIRVVRPRHVVDQTGEPLGAWTVAVDEGFGNAHVEEVARAQPLQVAPAETRP